MKIAVAGLGYVGLSNSVLLAQNHPVIGVDLDQTRVNQINAGQSPLEDPELADFLTKDNLDLTATTDGASAFRDAEIVVIATPTNYDPTDNYFDTSSIEGRDCRNLGSE